MTIVNITVENDADFFQHFQYVTVDDPPIPINLTGISMEMMLRRSAADEAAYLRLSTEGGAIGVVEPQFGQFFVYIAQAALVQLSLGDYVHSLIATAANGRKTKIWSGTLTVNAGPTR